MIVSCQDLILSQGEIETVWHTKSNFLAAIKTFCDTPIQDIWVEKLVCPLSEPSKHYKYTYLRTPHTPLTKCSFHWHDLGSWPTMWSLGSLYSQLNAVTTINIMVLLQEEVGWLGPTVANRRPQRKLSGGPMAEYLFWENYPQTVFSKMCRH